MEQDSSFVAPSEPSEKTPEAFNIQYGEENQSFVNDSVEKDIASQEVSEESSYEAELQTQETPSSEQTNSSFSSSSSTPSSSPSASSVRRTLGFGALFFITINAIFGSSLTYLPGLGMQMVGPSSILLWIAVFLIGLYIASCLAELISLYPKNGNIYKFARNAFGHFTGFLVGWTSWLTGNMVASLSIVWSLEYLFPQAGTLPFLVKLAVGVGLVLLFNIVVFFGMNLSTVILVSFSVLTLLFITLQTIPLFFNIQVWFTQGLALSPFDIHRFAPFFIHQGLPANLLFLFGALFLISEAFMGLSGITYLSQDTKSPEKNLPKALLRAVLFVALLSLVYVVGSIGVLPFQQYITSLLPHKDLLTMLWKGPMQMIMLAGTGLIILAPAITWIVTGPRLLASMAGDKLFLEQHSQIHKKWKTPHKAIKFQTFIISAFVVFFYFLYLRGFADPYKLIHEVFLVMVFFMLSLVVLSVPRLRKKFPDAPRRFKSPGGSWGPWVLVSVFVITLLAYTIPFHELNIISKAFSLIFVAVPVYLLLILYYNPDATKKAYSSLSSLSKFFENIILPRRIRKRILNVLGDLEEKIVFEYGSSVGTLTLELAKATGPNGLVHAVDFSESNIKLLQKRLDKHHHSHVHAIYDEFMVTRIHPSVQEADVVVSIGTLDHVQDLAHLVEDIDRILPEEGQVLFVEYADFFGVLPNSGWLSDLDRLKTIFRDNGFAVKIIRWRGFLWNYVAIYGVKTDEDIVMV